MIEGTSGESTKDKSGERKHPEGNSEEVDPWWWLRPLGVGFQRFHGVFPTTDRVLSDAEHVLLEGHRHGESYSNRTSVTVQMVAMAGQWVYQAKLK